MPLLDYLILAFITACLSVLGDLLAAFLKRAAGIRDSGRSLGEHGGFLDRLDSLLLNGPFYVWYAFELKEFMQSPTYSTDTVHIFEFIKFKLDPLS